MTAYATGETKVEPRLAGMRRYFVAVLYNVPAHVHGVGRTPLDAIRDLLDREDRAKPCTTHSE